MRLDKLVADSALVTRSEARNLIKKGLVLVDGELIKDIAARVDERSALTVSGKSVSYKKYIYIMLNKPAGYISATEDKKQKTVMELLDPSFKRYSLFPAGRLDIDTEGFLLITNDGNLSHNLLSPSKKVGKTYYVKYDASVSDKALEMFEQGVDIGECVTKPAKTKRISDTEIYLTIGEGKFHQIKRMAIAVGINVAYLKRMAYGGLWLDENLKIGEYKVLSEADMSPIYNVYK